MKRNTFKEIKTRTVSELIKTLSDLRNELAGKKRKEIAQILTTISEKNKEKS
jgi:ribosomal protein L29